MAPRRSVAVAATVALTAAASVTLVTAVAETKQQQAGVGGFVGGSKTAADADRLKEATRNLLRKKIEMEIEQQQEQQRAAPPPTPEQLEARRQAKKERTSERRRRAALKFAKMKPESSVEQVSPEEVARLSARAKVDDPAGTKPQNQWLRTLGWWDYGGGGSDAIPADYSPYEDGYADPGYPWDMWAQAYRMLGGFIDCDWKQGDGDRRRRMQMRDQNDRDLSGSGEESTENACGRWMMWAAYVNPNYQGGGYEEYFGNNDDDGDNRGSLDCHSPDTEWELIGVYRQEFYQFLEQISKHLWAIDDYEYAIALGGLAYMTDADCFEANGYYAGVLPLEGGTFQMSIFQDDACLYPDSSITLDDVGWGGGDNDGRLLGEDECRRRHLEDGGNAMDCDTYAYAQEDTLTEMNDVYDTYRYCTLCIDYPTYQDGYFIGDYGTDEDDLINQCWKFHSHDSFPCNSDCMALGSMQGSILEVQVGKTVFGTEWEGSSNVVNSQGEVVSGRHSATRLERIKANLFLTFAGILFVATFLAFAVARGSGRERRSRSSKSRSLLSPEEKRRARSSSRRRQSSSRSKSERRSKSRGGEGRSSSRAASSSRKARSSGDGSPRKSSKSKSSRSRRHLDDF